MEYKNITNKIKIPVIGIGTWKMGGDLTPNYDNDEKYIKSLKQSIELGLTHIDTAKKYSAGHAEELVGKAIKNFDRNKLFITTKVAKENLSYNDVLQAMDDSLKRLNTSYIDLYLIHAPNPEVPIEETMKAMDYLVETGKTKLIGVSNFSVRQLKEAQKYSKNKIVANQIEYNLIIRNEGQFTDKMESEIIPYCQKNDILVIAYRPLAKGKLLSNKYPLLDELSKKYSKTKAQIAINWLISKKGIITIPKASGLAHIQDNVGSIGWKMDEEDIKKLDTSK
ncbi:aldo/keto reductase [bacterium]|nr:aldo/keto reductase [bacterium]